jgi:hypothetical protein
LKLKSCFEIKNKCFFFKITYISTKPEVFSCSFDFHYRFILLLIVLKFE